MGTWPVSIHHATPAHGAGLETSGSWDTFFALPPGGPGPGSPGPQDLGRRGLASSARRAADAPRTRSLSSWPPSGAPTHPYTPLDPNPPHPLEPQHTRTPTPQESRRPRNPTPRTRHPHNRDAPEPAGAPGPPEPRDRRGPSARSVASRRFWAPDPREARCAPPLGCSRVEGAGELGGRWREVGFGGGMGVAGATVFT